MPLPPAVSRRRPPLAGVVALLLLCAPGRIPAAAPLPAIDGELGGVFSALALPGAPPLRWKIQSAAVSGDHRHLVVSAEGDQTQLHAEVDVNLDTLAGTWTLSELRGDLGPWYLAGASRLGAIAAGLHVRGHVRVTGRGTFSGRQAAGSLTVHTDDLMISDPTAGWTLAGVALDGAFSFDTAGGVLRSIGPATVTVRTITTARFGARNLHVSFRVADPTTAEIDASSVEIAGGEATGAPCALTLAPFKLETDVTFTRVGLQDVAALVPQAVREARGRVDGVLRVGWSSAEGLIIGEGKITLRGDEPAEVRLAPSPGLITSHLPENVLKYYPGLPEAELGKVPIKASALDVRLTPQRDKDGHTAVIQLVGVPAVPNAQSPVYLNANVNGPLEYFVSLGSKSKISLHFR